MVLQYLRYAAGQFLGRGKVQELVWPVGVGLGAQYTGDEKLRLGKSHTDGTKNKSMLQQNGGSDHTLPIILDRDSYLLRS